MSKSWLWDRQISEKEVRKILMNPGHEAFVHYASLLLSRMNEPRQVFKNYLGKQVFCAQWNKIKRQMQKDKWNKGRILFWQEIYRYLLDEFKAEGIRFRQNDRKIEPETLSYYIAKEVRLNRRSRGLTQAELAKASDLSQQVISNIEKGTANPSLMTLEKIRKGLGLKPAEIASLLFSTEVAFAESATNWV